MDAATTPYQELIELIQQHKSEIAHQIANGMNQSNSFPTESNPSTLNKRIIEALCQHIDRMVEYLSSGNIESWRDYIINIAAGQNSNVYSTDNLLIIGDLIRESLVSLVQRELADPERSKDRERYIRRLNGLNGLSQSTIVASRLKQTGHF